jgi:hypothetical protein
LAGAALPRCAITTVPLAIPLKRQGAGDGPLLAFIITSALLGPASIALTLTMFGLVWGALRVAYRSLRSADLAGVCSVLEASCDRAVETSTKSPPLPYVGAAAVTRLFFRRRPFFLGKPREHDRNLAPIPLLGLPAAAASSVLIGKAKNGCATTSRIRATPIPLVTSKSRDSHLCRSVILVIINNFNVRGPGDPSGHSKQIRERETIFAASRKLAPALAIAAIVLHSSPTVLPHPACSENIAMIQDDANALGAIASPWAAC